MSRYAEVTKESIMGKVKKPRERSILKGALAGLVGGVAGSGAKVLAESIYPPHAEEGSTSRPDSNEQLEISAKPWILGAMAGAAYGAAIEIEPKAGVWRGAGFGLALKKLNHEATPLRPAAIEPTVRERTRNRQSEWVTYAVFGVVTEAVRRLVRKGL
jgi:putative membrane protein